MEFSRNTSKSGALKPKETPVDPVLAARTWNFLAGGAFVGCRQLRQGQKTSRVGEECEIVGGLAVAIMSRRGR